MTGGIVRNYELRKARAAETNEIARTKRYHIFAGQVDSSELCFYLAKMSPSERFVL
jgi:hypothetical protein